MHNVDPAILLHSSNFPLSSWLQGALTFTEIFLGYLPSGTMATGRERVLENLPKGRGRNRGRLNPGERSNVPQRQKEGGIHTELAPPST
ncbi:hypothetical protein AMECASPLE_004671 [Ameca splendens]|uniref:Uncharacterized protein n=1 Tax=Ameca splendens TaxID=208324 RepID=A0ABV0XN70_9TELE